MGLSLSSFPYSDVAMAHDAKASFLQRYQNSLKEHMMWRTGRRSTSQLARSLGGEGVALGMNIFELVRAHTQAVATLSEPPSTNAGQTEEKTAPPVENFLLEAMRPFEEERQRQIQSANATKQLSVEQLALEVQRNKQLLADSQRLQAELQRLTHELLMAQEEERKEISRELHDEVGQILVGINVRLAALKETGVTNKRELQRNITRTQRLVEKSVKVVHRYARKLRPTMLDDLGLIPTLRSFIKDLPGSKGLRIHFTAFPGIEALDNNQRTMLYRVAQEALTNVARHAHAQIAIVRIQKTPEGIRLEVKDDGKSFPVERILTSRTHKRLGLLGMRERIEMAGGKFTVTSVPGKGTTVRAEIPFKSTASVKP